MHPPHTQGPAGVPCQGHPNHLSLRNRRSQFRFSPMWRPARLFAIGTVFCLIALFAPAGATAMRVAPPGRRRAWMSASRRRCPVRRGQGPAERP